MGFTGGKESSSLISLSSLLDCGEESSDVDGCEEVVSSGFSGSSLSFGSVGTQGLDMNENCRIFSLKVKVLLLDKGSLHIRGGQ